jgi:hypothetical protein
VPFLGNLLSYRNVSAVWVPPFVSYGCKHQLSSISKNSPWEEGLRVQAFRNYMWAPARVWLVFPGAFLWTFFRFRFALMEQLKYFINTCSEHAAQKWWIWRVFSFCLVRIPGRFSCT